ncbi:MAG: MXAN_5187 C-terminal domain-containing protein [Myxococcales bacterium]|jgi:hypothetical protein
MLLSRFWYVLLAAGAVAATAAALLAEGVVNNTTDEHLQSSLVRDRVTVDAFLRLEARTRLDRIAFITVDPKLGSVLRQARGVTDDDKLASLNSEAKQALRAHVTRLVEAGKGSKTMEPDLAFALDADGRIIAQLGPMQANPAGSSLATYPLVRRALQGYLRDDVWVYDRRVYRMAARPVMFGSQYAGAIVHGYKYDSALAERVGKSLGGATVAFFHGTNVLASYSPTAEAGAPQRAEIAAALPDALTDPAFAKGKRTQPRALQSGARAVFVPITGTAAKAGVGYAVARPRAMISSPQELFEKVSRQDVEQLPVAALGGGFLLAVAVGFLFMFLERDRHLKALTRKTAEIASGDRDRLIITEWRGGYRKIADAINNAIDHEVERSAGAPPPSRKKKADLDDILGPTGEAQSGGFFGFADDAAPPSSGAASPPPSAPNSAPNPAPSPTPPPPAAPTKAAPSPPPPAPPSPAPESAGGAAPGVQGADDAETHFREVYEQYVATRKQCGEPTDNLTFEKFSATLRKQRDNIMQKHNARDVRFAVQVKQGKAALKAQPVKH